MADVASTRTRYNFYIEERQREGLRLVKERDGVLESEQIRRAIDAWLLEKGVTKTERQRPASRRRS